MRDCTGTEWVNALILGGRERRERVIDYFQNIVRRPNKLNSYAFIWIGKIILWDKDILTKSTHGRRPCVVRPATETTRYPKSSIRKCRKFELLNYRNLMCINLCVN